MPQDLRCATSNQHAVLSLKGTVREEGSGCYVMLAVCANIHVEVIFKFNVPAKDFLLHFVYRNVLDVYVLSTRY